MAVGNVGNITPRANVCSCRSVGQVTLSCDCFTTNMIGSRELAMTENDTSFFNNNINANAANNNTNMDNNLFM